MGDNVKKLRNYILEGCSNNKRLGVEIEHFVVDDDLIIISQKQMSEVLITANEKLKGKLIYENGFAVSLYTDDYSITLEPGMQLEVSIKPVSEIKEIGKIYNDFSNAFMPILSKIGFKFLSTGIFPLIQNGEKEIEEIAIIDKKRYKLMDEYLSKRGKFARFMMRATCSTQISIDYVDEKDAIKKFKLFEKLTPFMSLMMENQYNLGIDKDKFKPHLLRNQIWANVDSDRCGYIENSLSDAFDISSYAKCVYESPFIIDKQDENLIATGNKTGKEYYSDKELDDVDYYLSMFFHHVRFRKYVEIRCADANDIDKALAYATLIKVIAYNKHAFKKVSDLLSFIKNENDLIKIEDNIEKNGYDATLGNKDVSYFILKILEIVCDYVDKEDKKYLPNIINTPIANEMFSTYIENQNSYSKKNDLSNDIKIIKKYIKQSPMGFYYKDDVKLFYLPKVYIKNDIDKFKNIIETFYKILRKVIRLYKSNENIRKLFGFDKKLEGLILNSFSGDIVVPMSRIDLFYDESTSQFKFCEINTDGTSSMMEDKVLNEAIRKSLIYSKYIKALNLNSFELFDKWIDEFLTYYNQYAKTNNSPKKPNVAIVDFLEKGIGEEFKVFKEYFEKHGLNVEICDIRKLKYIDGALYTENKEFKIDAIYRRAVTNDIMNNLDDVEDFMKAVNDKKVCLVGDFHTQIIHNKRIFYILHLDEIQKHLSFSERLFIKYHVPMTYLLNDELFNNKMCYNDICDNKDKWILKPVDSYGSRGVFAGKECSKSSWKELLDKFSKDDYIVQEFADIHFTKNFSNLDSDFEEEHISNLTNLFCYNEKFAGMLSRGSRYQLINIKHGEMTMPSLVFGNYKYK